MLPLVSIIIPTYNRNAFLGETLDSVLSQTYQNWECIIIDDGSLDYTIELIGFYTETDSRIKFFKRPLEKNKGAAACRNVGLEKAKGAFIQFLDDDDLIHQEKIEKQINQYSPGDEKTLFTCQWGWFKKSSFLKQRFKHNYKCYRNFKNGINLLHIMGVYDEYLPVHNYLISIKLIKESGLWNENLNNNDDAEYFTRVILNSAKIIFVDDAEVYYRAENSNKLSEINSESKIKSVIGSWELIEKHLKVHNKWNFNPYVARAKYNLHEYFERNFPHLIDQNKEFFKGRKRIQNVVIPLRIIFERYPKLKPFKFNF